MTVDLCNTEHSTWTLSSYRTRSSCSLPGFSSVVWSMMLTDECANKGSAGISWFLLRLWSTCTSTRALSTCRSLFLSHPGKRCCSRSTWKEWPMTAAHFSSNCSSELSWSSWFTAISANENNEEHHQKQQQQWVRLLQIQNSYVHICLSSKEKSLFFYYIYCLALFLPSPILFKRGLSLCPHFECIVQSTTIRLLLHY